MERLSVDYGKPLHEEGGEARASAATKGVEHKESLEAGTSIGQLPDAVEHKVHNLLANGVVAPSVVVSGILLAGDQLFGMVQLAVGAVANLINNRRLEIDEHSPRDIVSSSSLGEEGVEGVISSSKGLVRGHGTIGGDTVLQTVQLPTAVAHLATSLSHMDRDALTHFGG